MTVLWVLNAVMLSIVSTLCQNKAVHLSGGPVTTKVLRGYSNLPGINCGICGMNYMYIEATDDPKMVKVRCWCGSSSKGPIDHPTIQAALGPQHQAPQA